MASEIKYVVYRIQKTGKGVLNKLVNRVLVKLLIRLVDMFLD
jgi:hypothetical protein